MVKEKNKKRYRAYERTEKKNTSGNRINKKAIISAAIVMIVIFIKLLSEGSINSTVNGIFKTSTDYRKMLGDIGNVISRHTTGINGYENPVNTEKTSGFGERTDPFTNEISNHTGIDFDAPLDTEIKASYGGEVVRVEENQFYGKFIMIKHNENTQTLYGHLNEALVSIGDTVKKGDVIAKSGNTGRSTGPHLHFEVRVDNVPVDPEDYLI